MLISMLILNETRNQVGKNKTPLRSFLSVVTSLLLPSVRGLPLPSRCVFQHQKIWQAPTCFRAISGLSCLKKKKRSCLSTRQNCLKSVGICVLHHTNIQYVLMKGGRIKKYDILFQLHRACGRISDNFYM